MLEMVVSYYFFEKKEKKKKFFSNHKAFVRQFLVSWISILDSVPDLELLSYLPAFLDGLFGFLSDSNKVTFFFDWILFV